MTLKKTEAGDLPRTDENDGDATTMHDQGGQGNDDAPGVDDLAPETSQENNSGAVTLDNLTGDHAALLEGFDPAIHAVDAEGNPKKKGDGSFAKKRGRKAGQTTTTPRPSVPVSSALPPKNAPAPGPAGSTVEGAALPGQEPDKISNEAAAKMASNLVFNAGVMVFGRELGAPANKDEANGMKIAFKDYFDARGTPDIPPEIGLLIAVGGYALPRLQHETMADKVAKWAKGLKRMFGKKPKILEGE